MSNAHNTVSRPRQSRKNRRVGPNTTEFSAWLSGLDPQRKIEPTIHINGHTFYSALVVVDFGEPISPIDLTSEQAGELFSRLRALAKEVVNKEVNITIYSDSYGIYWASVL